MDKSPHELNNVRGLDLVVADSSKPWLILRFIANCLFDIIIERMPERPSVPAWVIELKACWLWQVDSGLDFGITRAVYFYDKGGWTSSFAKHWLLTF